MSKKSGTFRVVVGWEPYETFLRNVWWCHLYSLPLLWCSVVSPKNMSKASVQRYNKNN